ncbi:MAG: cysteate synthase [Halobacteriota archaeon]|jgi:cysteate synthase
MDVTNSAPNHYKIICVGCHSDVSGAGYGVRCGCGNALSRTVYQDPRLEVTAQENMWRFAAWLPTADTLPTRGRSVTYKSEGFARELGLKELFISFNGYWPEKNAFLETCSFKELESPPTVQRAVENKVKTLVVSSVGNTARAFAHTVSTTSTELKLVLVGLESAAGKLWLPEPPSGNIKLVLLERGNDYSDAISLGNRLTTLPGLVAEGGAMNVARRDGMGTVVLEAAITIGRAPDHYFQAVGSGTGGIAAWEASLRLKHDGRFVKDHLPKLHLSQNLPFVPMFSAWNAQRRTIEPSIDMPDATESIEKLYADVLSNRNPAYAIKGGVFDALKDTGGRMYAVSNNDAQSAARLFEDLEGIDIVPAAAVATASLMDAVAYGSINDLDVVLLNVSGGGVRKVKEDKECYPIRPAIRVARPDTDLAELQEVLT